MAAQSLPLMAHLDTLHPLVDVLGLFTIIYAGCAGFLA